MIAKCYSCEKEYNLKIDIDKWIDFKINRKSSPLIQLVFPELTADERELLISGICGKCFDDIFSELEDEITYEYSTETSEVGREETGS